ncbi:MAG: hypothetical protein H6Q15_1543 [Bacteroidetes bacterium]|nr:hypothetical protein [Bacteroidota bacterium]
MKTKHYQFNLNKMKTMKVKALLLSLVAVLTLGLTSCTDELGDNTQGQPGYLTLNLKTLKPKATKVGTAAADDYKFIKDLNIFVFDGSHNLILNKYYDNATTTFDLTGGATSLSIQVNTLPSNAYVVAVANYGSRMSTITNYTDLEATPIVTVKDFATNGLHMTGKGDIVHAAGTYVYSAVVKIAPVEAKITVNWNFTAGSDAENYDVTGVYVVNAIDKTTMPIILNTTTVPATGNINPTATTNNITTVTGARTASTGLAAVALRDFNFYGAMNTNTALLSDEKTTEITGNVLDAGYTAMTKPYHYYVGENYNTDAFPTQGGGAIRADNTAQNENTLVVIKVTPKSTAPSYIKAMGHKYYTYEFNKNSAAQNNTNLGSVPATGFSVRRKTNYSLTFNLSEIGANQPFTRLSTLNVSVTAEGWDPATVTF